MDTKHKRIADVIVAKEFPKKYYCVAAEYVCKLQTILDKCLQKMFYFDLYV